MAAGSSSRSFSRTSFPATVLESEHGKREEGEGVPLWWLRAWVSGWKVVGHGRPWMAACELAESSLVEQRGKAVGWGWSSRVWRCLPREELNQGGLVGEIKRSTGLCTSARGRRKGSARLCAAMAVVGSCAGRSGETQLDL